MIQISIALLIVAVFGQPLSVIAMDCFDNFAKNTFKRFDIQLDGPMESFGSKLSNFYIQGESRLSDISVTQTTNLEVGSIYVWSDLNKERPHFYLHAAYTIAVVVSGKHTTSGTLIAETPFSEQGNFNAILNVTRSLDPFVYFKPTPTENLEIQKIEFEPWNPYSKLDIDYSDTETFDGIYFENISQSSVYNGHQKYINRLLYKIQKDLVEKIHQQVKVHAAAFWQRNLAVTKLTDICTTPLSALIGMKN